MEMTASFVWVQFSCKGGKIPPGEMIGFGSKEVRLAEWY